jgi:hypothetical protein
MYDPALDFELEASGACASRSEERHASKVLAGSPSASFGPSWCTSATGTILNTSSVPFTKAYAFRYIAEMQLELFPFDQITEAELATTFRLIRNSYWHLRNLRGARWGEARARKQYRLVAAQKKRLLMAGVSKREILDLLACCRNRCSRTKHPFKPCRYCP